MKKLSATQYEQRSLTAGMWANLVMGISGVTAAQLSNSDALMVDGLYSAVNFASAIIAGRVAATVTRRADSDRPYGYEANESVYVLFRALVLLGILAFAGFNSLSKIVDYARGESVPELILGPIAVYALCMVAISFSLAAWHGHNYRLTGKASAILKTERTASLVDGLMSAGAGVALIGVTFLRGTPLEVIIPVSDAIVVLLLALFMIGGPASMFTGAVREVLSMSVDAEMTQQVRERIESAITDHPCELLQVSVTKFGRIHNVVSYVKPNGSVDVTDLEELRSLVTESYAELFNMRRSEVVFTSTAPY